MPEDLEHRLAELERRVDALQTALDADRSARARGRRRDAWMRIAFWIVLALAYLVYFRSLPRFG